MLTRGNEKNNRTAYDYYSSCAFYLFAVLVVLLCQGVAGVVAAAIERAYAGASSGGIFNTACMIFFQAANFAFIYFYTRIMRKKLNFDYFKNSCGRGVTPKIVILPILLAVVLMCGMYLPTLWYGYFTRAIGIPESAGALELDSAGAIVMIVIASVIFAPIFEETIYRGVLLHGLKDEFSVTKSVMLVALAFMMMHMSPLQVVFQFALGVLSGYLAIKSERLLPSVILHATANALALIIQLTPFAAVLDGSVVWLTNHIAAAVMITILFFAVAFFICFVLLRYAFDKTHLFTHGGVDAAKPDDNNDDGAAEQADSHAQEIMKEQVMSQITRRDGLARYFIGIGICAVMFIINLVSMIVL
ncbi:MAG: CPBP family intramembrane metalloprotease [Clostridiales bacterium]|nr:CPBP family intramembrane metalloprotease [Clostridiales bacterium]